MALTPAEKQKAYRERQKKLGRKAKNVFVDADDLTHIREMALHADTSDNEILDSFFNLALLRNKQLWLRVEEAKKDGIPDNIICAYVRYETRREPMSVKEFQRQINEARQQIR